MEKRVALVTGGVGGLGSAISRCLARDGFTVVANYIVPDSDKKWLDSMRQSGYADVHAVYGDVSDFEAMGAMVQQIKSDIGPINVLVNCAGITRDGVFKKMQKDHWDRVMRVNLDGVFNVTRHVIDDMIESNHGRIINISSVNGVKGQFGQTNYSAAKAGILGFTKALAQEVIRHGVTVNAISPGYTGTEMVLGMKQEVLDKIVAQIPAGRLGKPEEIGEAVAFLASDRASFITGANFNVNGGQHMY